MNSKSAQCYLDKLCKEVGEVLQTEPARYTCIWWRGHIYGAIEVILATTVDASAKIDFTDVEAAREKLYEAEQNARQLR